MDYSAIRSERKVAHIEAIPQLSGNGSVGVKKMVFANERIEAGCRVRSGDLINNVFEGTNVLIFDDS